MIITDTSTIDNDNDNADTVSIATLVSGTPERNKMPRFFAGLTYISLIISVFPFTFSLLNIVTTRLFSVPTMLAYVFTTPFHVGALLIIWQHKRQIDMQLPFNVSSWRSLIHLSFLALMWLFSATTSGIGGRRFLKKRICWDGDKDLAIPCSQHNFAKMTVAFVSATLFSVFEFFVLAAIITVCFRSRPRKEVQDPIPLARIPSPKVISV